MEILNRVKAPFGTAVWGVIDSTLGEFLTKRLSLRSVVDFNGGLSYETDSISTKKTSIISNKDGLKISTREPIKMVEIKKNFKILKETIEDIKKGMVDFDDKVFAKVANEFSSVENGMILLGLESANIQGILKNTDVKSLDVKSTKDILSTVAKALGIFNQEFVDGTFKLVISSSTLSSLYTEFFDGISVKTKIDDILGAGQIVINQDIGDDKALLISQRGGDFEFYSGLDVSIGFEKETEEDVELFLLQTCAFRVIAGEAAIVLNLK